MASTIAPTLPSYNVNPTPQGGSGAYGAVPGAVALPPSIFQQMQSNIPGFDATTAATTGVINQNLSGQISPSTTRQLQNSAAAYGVGGGVPGSGLQLENFLGNIGLTSENLQQTGVGDYLNFLSGVGATQTDPALAASVAEQNATNAAAPNPAAQAQQEQNMFDQYMKSVNPPNLDPWGNTVTPGESWITDPSGTARKV